MLHLLAGLEVILARRRWRRLSDAVPPAERRQRRIRQLRAARHQLLMDSHEIPLARGRKAPGSVARYGSAFSARCNLRHGGGVRAQDFAHRHAGDPQHPRDLAFAHSLRVQFQNRGALRLAQHAVLAPVGFFVDALRVALQCASICCRAGFALLRHPSPQQPRRPAAGAARFTIATTISRSRNSSAAGPGGAFACACRCALKNSSGSSRMRLRTAARSFAPGAHTVGRLARVSQ